MSVSNQLTNSATNVRGAPLIIGNDLTVRRIPILRSVQKRAIFERPITPSRRTLFRLMLLALNEQVRGLKRFAGQQPGFQKLKAEKSAMARGSSLARSARGGRARRDGGARDAPHAERERANARVVELEAEIQHGEEKLRIRPIRPDDEPTLQAFTRRLTPEDVRMRFFGPMRELSHELAARLTQIDYDREMAFVLLDGDEMVGVGRLVADPDFQQAEFALTVASDRQGRGYGELLLRHVLHYGKSRGIKRVVGHVLRENRKMLDLAKQVGFRRESGRSGEPDIRVVKSLGTLD